MNHFQNTWLPSQFLTENTFHRDDNFGHCNIFKFTFATQSLVIWLQIFQISVISLLGCNWYSLFSTPFVHAIFSLDFCHYSELSLRFKAHVFFLFLCTWFCCQRAAVTP